jgi:hypothetical protein
VAGDAVWLGLSSLTGEVARATVSTLFGLLALSADGAAAADAVVSEARAVWVDEHAGVADEPLPALFARGCVNERARARDRVLSGLRAVFDEAAVVSDELLSDTATLCVEHVEVSDEPLGLKRAATLVTERARPSDAPLSVAGDWVHETTPVSDEATGRLVAGERLVETLGVYDSWRETGLPGGRAEEWARVSDARSDHLRAADLVTDEAAARGHAVDDRERGQAWTSNLTNWAMSRYAPFAARGVALIHGVPHVWTSDGVYALRGRNEEIRARVTTGRLDCSKGVLAHPLYAYMEYAMDARAALSVTQTQRGVPERFTYPLPPERSAARTNGRFVLGQGLRGRYFTFTLRLDGYWARVEDLHVALANTKRRV